MTNDQVTIVLYLFFCAIRVSTFRRRWSLPLFRGQEWFFDVQVAPDFYQGPGRGILRRHRLLLLTPYILEACVLAAILLAGHLIQVRYLILALVPVTIGNHMLAVKASQRQARQYSVGGERPPAAAVTLSLKTRRLSDYTNRTVEAVIALGTVGSLAWMAHLYSTVPDLHNFPRLFGKPFLLLYLQAGAMLIKRSAVVRRSPVPREGAEAYLAWREEGRRYVTQGCDVFRLSLVAGMIYLAVLRSLPWEPDQTNAALEIGYLATLAVLVFWMKSRARQFMASLRGSRPMNLPALEGEAPAGRWLCYQPEKPLMLVKGVRGYTLNMASRGARLGLLYVAGLVALCFCL